VDQVFVSGQALHVFEGHGLFSPGQPLNHPELGLMPLIGAHPSKDGCIFEGPRGAPKTILMADAVAACAELSE